MNTDIMKDKTYHIQDVCDRFFLPKKDAARIAKEAEAIRKEGRWPVYDIEKIREYIESGAGSQSENRLKSFRKSNGLTQKKVGELTGVPKRTLENWEEGHTIPPDWLISLVIDKLESCLN